VRKVLACAQFAQCARQCAAVRLVVCELCDNLAVWGSAAVCDSAPCCVRQCALLYAAECGSALAMVCGSAHGGMRAVIYKPNIPCIYE
jgi:hypothetical protein